MTSKVNIVLGLFVSVFLFITVPFTVFASEDTTPGFTRHYSTGEVFITDSPVTVSETWYYSFDEVYSGSYTLWLYFNYGTVFNQIDGGSSASYTTDFKLIIDGHEYEALYVDKDSCTVYFNVAFTSPIASHFAIKCNLTYWTSNPPVYENSSGSFDVSLTLTHFSIRDISSLVPSQYVIDEAGNLLLQKGNELQEESNILQENANAMQSEELEKLDDIINGYDSTSESDAVKELENTYQLAMQQENSINNDAFGYIDGYTINTDGVVGYATQFLTVFPLVSTMLQSIFDSSGPFGIIFSVVFTMTIVCMLIGMFRWYKS